MIRARIVFDFEKDINSQVIPPIVLSLLNILAIYAFVVSLLKKDWQLVLIMLFIAIVCSFLVLLFFNLYRDQKKSIKYISNLLSQGGYIHTVESFEPIVTFGSEEFVGIQHDKKSCYSLEDFGRDYLLLYSSFKLYYFEIPKKPRVVRKIAVINALGRYYFYESFS